MSNPVIPAEGTSTEEPVTAAETAPATGTSSTPTTTDKPAATTARESTPKPNKRNSIFGSFFNKKEPSASTTPTVNTTTQEPGPAVPSKETELATTSPTVPQTETATKETAPTVDTNAPVTTTETPATTSATTPVSPDTSKANRRSSFFSNLGTKKEKRTGGVSDAEGTDGEGKKSGGFGGLLRKASRAQGHKPTSKPAPATDGVTDKEAPAPINKEPPTTEPTTDNEVVSETTTAPSQTPVQAAA